LAEKPVSAEGLAQALCKIWCPIRGVTCKDLGENRFLFTFLQASGKRRALDDGPWMFGKDLVVMAEFDESKVLEEMEFFFYPNLGSCSENASGRDEQSHGGGDWG
jgi:hypothetical protein